MTQVITPGRWNGLRTTSTNKDVFTILAFDQRGSYKRMLPDNTPYEEATQIKVEIVSALSNYASAVLLDPDYGLLPAAMMSSTSGLLLSLEKSGYSGDATYRRTEFMPGWNVEKIKRVGGSAVKLMVYYHPHSGALADELDEMMAGVIEECHKHDIAIFVEPMSYSLEESVSKDSPEFAETKTQVVEDTARRISALNPDVLKLEFPFDHKYNSDENAWKTGCVAVSAASAVPWVLLSAGVDFETFETQTKIACEAGASGFLAGRAIWKEAVTMTQEERQHFLNETAIPRIKKLIDVAEAHSKPWTDFYKPQTFKTGWYENY